MDRDLHAYPSVAAAAVSAALRRAALAARETMRAPASFAEEALWRVVSRSDAPGPRNRAWAAMVDGPLDTSALRQALADLIACHDGLRAGYLEDDGRLWRTSVRQCWVRMPIDDFTHGPTANLTATAALWARRLSSRAIDLAQAPLVRLGVARLGEDRHALALVTHRLVADRCSQALLLRELGERYALHLQAAGEGGTRVPPAAVAPSYAEWASAQRERVEADAYAPVRQWWAHRLEGALPLSLRTDLPRPDRRSFAGGRVPMRIDAQRVRALRALAWRAGVTPFVALLSVWQLVLSQCAEQSDVLVAAPVSHRERAGADRIFGAMADLLPLRAQLDAQHDFGALLVSNRETVRDAVGLRGAPWARVAPSLDCRAAFSMQAPPAPLLTLAGCTLARVALDDEPCFHDLSLHLEPRGDEFEGALIYARELFLPETAARIAAQVGVLLDAVLARPDSPLAELPGMGGPPAGVGVGETV